MNYCDTISDFVESCRRCGMRYGVQISRSCGEIVRRTYEGIKEKYRSLQREVSEHDLFDIFYMEVRNREHFGKHSAENYFANQITCMPLLDADLHRLKKHSASCPDDNLLAAIMFDRYCPYLLEVPFEGKRSIRIETVKYARKINKTYPYKKKKMGILSFLKGNKRTIRLPEEEPSGLQKLERSEINPVSLQKNTDTHAAVTNKMIFTLIQNAFFAPGVKKTFCALYSEKIYYRLAVNWSIVKFHPESNAYRVLAITKIADDCALSAGKRGNEVRSVTDYVMAAAADTCAENRPENNPRFNLYRSYYTMARVDILADGGSRMKIADYGESEITINSPTWIHKGERNGFVISSSKGSISLLLRFAGDGILKIALRGQKVKDKDNNQNQNQGPVVIDYTGFSINGRAVLDHVESTTHGTPYRYKQKVSDGDVLRLEITWALPV